MKKYLSTPVLVTMLVLMMAMSATSALAMQTRGETKTNPSQDGEANLEMRQQLQVNNPETEEVVQQRQEVREKVRTQLQERIQNQEQVRELAVGENKAMLRGGAEFSYDEKTGKVTVLTPSGQEHTLVNLPDVAVKKMTESGLLDTQPSDEDEVELYVELQGDHVVYSRRDSVKKKLFGILPITIDSEVILNDSTGEVTETNSSTGSFLQRLLDRLSF